MLSCLIYNLLDTHLAASTAPLIPARFTLLSSCHSERTPVQIPAPVKRRLPLYNVTPLVPAGLGTAMTSPQDGPDAFDYDVLADVSHHGASVFDFLSQPNMFGPGASIHSPSMGASPLGHPRSAADHHMSTLSLVPSIPTDVSMGMV
eukprot:IDg15398t1